MDSKTSNPPTVDLKNLLKPYLNKWYWFVLGAFICLILSFIYIRISTPVYNVKGAVLIKDAKKSLSSDSQIGMLDGLSGFGGMSTNSIENELEVFKTKKLVRDVVDIHNLQTIIVSKSGVKNQELFADTNPFVIRIVKEKKGKDFPEQPFLLSLDNNRATLESDEYGFKQNIVFGRLVDLPFATIIITKNNSFDKEKAGNIGNTFDISFSSLESAASSIQKMLQIDLADKEATVINIGMNYPQTDKAKTIINGLIDEYNKDAILDKNSESQKTKEFIDERIVKIASELSNVEADKEQFKTNNKITDILTETKINLETSAEAKKKQLELEGQLELTNNLIGYLHRQASYQLLPSNMGLSSEESNTSIASYNKLVLERERLLENATTQNPLVVDLTKQIGSLKKSVDESLQKNKTALQLALNEYVNEQNSLDSRITKVPMQERLFRSLERQQQIKENLYLLLLQKREETAIALAVVAPKARVVEPVYISDTPVAPKSLMIIFIGLLSGFAIPFGLIYLKELTNTNIVDKYDLRKVSAIPVIAEIPSIKKNMESIIRQNDLSPLAESFRILVTNMNFMLNNEKVSHTIIVTSSVKGEGKTFVSMNLALALSASNKTIIIGADIRNPQLQRYQASKSNELGLANYLYDTTITPDKIIFDNPLNNKTDIIYSGTIPPNPTELLKNGRLKTLLDYLRTKYQYIIIDTAPLLLVTDTLTITNYADLKLYVTRSNYTGKALIDFANELVETGKLDHVAFILNDVRTQNLGYGNKYGYGYN